MMDVLNSRRLYSLLGEFKMFRSFSIDRVTTVDASNMPFMIWPNGSPCIIGNLYIQSLLHRPGRSNGLSRKGSKGGTMAGYAANVGQLLRRCYRDHIDPIHLTDGKFTDYIDELREEPSSSNPAQPKKTENAVIDTGKRWLDFLGFVGRFYGNPGFVSLQGAIRAREETYYIKTRSGKPIARTYMWHHSFGSYHRGHTRDPITDEQIKLLKATIRVQKASAFVKVRRANILDMLAGTGARRTEISLLRVEDVRTALAMEEPMLRLTTLKREDKAQRVIPILLSTLVKLNRYIEGERRKLMRKVYKDGEDHGFVFVSSTTGRPLSSDSISNEVRDLRKAAGIECQICPHMFRHAFITKLFVRFVTRHKINNADEFRQALLDTSTFLAEVVSWTGHIDPISLERYIHLAFRDVTSYSETLTSVHMVMAMDQYFIEEEELEARLEEGMPIAEYRQAKKALRELSKKEMEIAKRRESSLG
ncbi:tyrosine-type recombinase/integrase [Pseudomonas cannabina]|uniref:Site-specific recombinase, phage integrase protein n=3 Tax=Pseudomonas cannabina TaxID=86840 RepID=A0A3M3S1J7_PSECA|nr:tyrosine-type recombinase/integrase [Pseudomonas cannabina]KPW20782.1 Site-specific recombinase, phage integrase family protein [Pseudomonas cannabina pv. alisalensis]RMO02342.1 Site-specific recombinase, phage integrase protein [Pseudomonas cannabina]